MPSWTSRPYVVAAITVDTTIKTGSGQEKISVVAFQLQANTADVVFYFKSNTTQISGSITGITNTVVNSPPLQDGQFFCQCTAGQDLAIDIATSGGNLRGTVIYEVR